MLGVYIWTVCAGWRTKQGSTQKRWQTRPTAGVGPARCSSLPHRACATWVSGPDRPNATGRGFLGYLQEEIFWQDAFELVHEDDLPLLRSLVSMVMEEPGASESVEVRFRDAWGDWI